MFECEDPHNMIQHFGCAYKLVYGQEPRMEYVGNQWYVVNGEMVHHRVMMDEIAQLRDLARVQRARQSGRSVVQRLIDKLRLI